MRPSPPLAFALSSVVIAAVLAAGPAGAQSTQAQYVGAWPYGPAGAMAFDAARSLAFVGTGGVVMTVDISNPAAPTPVSDAIRTRGAVQGLAFDPATDRLFLAGGDEGLEIWDVQSPAAPQRLGSVRLTYFGVDVPANAVVVADDFAYVSASFGYVHVIDVSDPANPADIGFNGQGGNPSGELFLANGLLYVGGPFFSSFTIKPDGTLQLAATNPYTSAGSPFAAGNYAYGTQNGDLLIFDATQSTLPVLGFYSLANARDVWVTGNTAYVADATGGIRVLDVSNHASPVEIGADASVGTTKIEISGGRLYGTGSALFRALDISVPASPTETGSLESESLAYDVDVAGSHAYVADSNRGFYVLDVSDPADPVRVGQADTPGVALDVDVEGDYAYVACQFAGLAVFDVQDPTAPVEVGSVATPYYARGVFVQGATAYVADLSGGLRVIDVSNPAAPAEIGSAGPATSSHVFVQGDVAYVTNGSSGLGVVDVSNPAAPVAHATVATADYANGVFVQGDRAYVADFAGGLRILDLASPLSPVEIGSWAPPGVLAGAVIVSGSTAYVMDAGDGLRVVDVTNPASPTELDFYDTPGDAFQVFGSGSDLFVADGRTGVQIVRFGTPTAAPLAEASPTATRVAVKGGIARFALPAPGLALRIFDVRGRQVFTSRDREEVRFAPDASGAYFWRVEGSGREEGGKVVVVR